MDLWPNEFEVNSASFPARLLTEQAGLLAGKTQGKVVGEVTYSQFTDDEGRFKLVAQLTISAPQLSGIVHEAVTLTIDPVTTYPVCVSYGDVGSVAQNRAEFIDMLRQALRSSHTKGIVGQLLYILETTPLPESGLK